MTANSLAGLLVETADPDAAAQFWTSALGGEAIRQLDGSTVVRGDFPELTFYRQTSAKSVKNRVHLDIYTRSERPLLALGARVLAEYEVPQRRMTMADVDGNEFCAFIDPDEPASPPARVFAVCTDSDQPEELAAWWADVVGAHVGPGGDQTPRWLRESRGWPALIWKFVRTPDERVVPNRWRWTLRGETSTLLKAGARVAEAGVLLDPQGNEFCMTYSED